MRNLLFVLALLTCGIRLAAQDFLNRDSLWKEMRKSKPDTNRVLLFIQLGQQYENNNPDSAILLYENALHLSESLHYLTGIIKYYTNVTYVYNVKGLYDTALTLNLKSVEIAKELGDPKKLAACLANTAASYMAMSQSENAIYYFLESLKILDKHPDNRVQVIYSNLAVVYNDVKQYQKALEYGEKGLALARKTNNISIQISSLANSSNVYLHLNLPDKAIRYLEEAMQLARQSDNDYAELSCLLNLANAYQQKGDYAKLKAFYDKASPIANRLTDNESIALCLRGYSIYYFFTRELSKAQEYAQRSLDYSIKFSFPKHIAKAYHLLSDIAVAESNFELGERYYAKYDSVQQITFDESMVKHIQEMEVKYDAEKKEQTIKQLNQEAQIQSLSLKQIRLSSIILGVVLLAVSIIAFLSWRTYRQKKDLHEKENRLNEARISELEKDKQLVLADAILKGQEEERTRMAKDLHDGLGGLLSGVKISLSTMKGNMTMTHDNVMVFERSRDMLDNSIQELRRVSHNMMPESLVKFGLSAALRDFSESVNSMKALQVTYQLVGEERRLDSSQEIILYRIVQELLNNILKHSDAHNSLVQLMFEPESASITVEDDGSRL